MKNGRIMSDPAPIDPKALSDLLNIFDVSRDTYNHFNTVYNKNILPRLQKKYLAHLVASIEEIVDEKIKKDRKKRKPEDTSDSKTRDFFILLYPDNDLPNGKNAVSECQPKRAVIRYKKSEDYKELRIFIAHELGHILRHYEIILGNEDIENHANLFAFLAINGKNNFYKNEAKELVYTDEGEIISSIQKLHKIDEVRQIEKIPPPKNAEDI
jgi:hypothetical protein